MKWQVLFFTASTVVSYTFGFSFGISRQTSWLPPGRAAAATTTQCYHSKLLRPSSLVLFQSSNQDEIAELEARLEQLKKEEKEKQAQQQANPEISEGISVPLAAPQSDNLMPEMLSEQWKEAAGSQQSFNFVPLLQVVGIILFFIFFSQVPVGQENYTKYASVNQSTKIDLGDINQEIDSNEKPSYLRDI